MALPVYGWNEFVLAKLETTFGTAEAPVAASGLEVINLDMGPGEQNEVRAKKDKATGRDETLEFVQGRIQPIPFSVETTVKSRASAITAMKEGALLKAAGLVETIGGSNVTYGLSSDPTLQGLTVHAGCGTGTSTRLVEVGYGGVIKSLEFSGGDKELSLKAGGAFAGKLHQGNANVTFADGSTTAFSFTTGADSYRFGLGYYKVESEIVLVTAINYGAGTGTATRAQLTTTGAAHADKPMYGYVASPTIAGSPISEALETVTLDSVSLRAMAWSIGIQTGVDHLPLGAGSARAWGAKATRVKVEPKLRLVLTDDQVALVGKMSQRKSIALSIVSGTSAGGIFTFSMPTCELMPFVMPKPSNDVVIVDLALRVRGASGNDALSLVAA